MKTYPKMSPYEGQYEDPFQVCVGLVWKVCVHESRGSSHEGEVLSIVCCTGSPLKWGTMYVPLRGISKSELKYSVESVKLSSQEGELCTWEAWWTPQRKQGTGRLGTGHETELALNARTHEQSLRHRVQAWVLHLGTSTSESQIGEHYGVPCVALCGNKVWSLRRTIQEELKYVFSPVTTSGVIVSQR